MQGRAVEEAKSHSGKSVVDARKQSSCPAEVAVVEGGPAGDACVQLLSMKPIQLQVSLHLRRSAWGQNTCGCMWPPNCFTIGSIGIQRVLCTQSRRSPETSFGGSHFSFIRYCRNHRISVLVQVLEEGALGLVASEIESGGA
jgi:hypothetical protein